MKSALNFDAAPETIHNAKYQNKIGIIKIMSSCRNLDVKVTPGVKAKINMAQTYKDRVIGRNTSMSILRRKSINM